MTNTKPRPVFVIPKDGPVVLHKGHLPGDKFILMTGPRSFHAYTLSPDRRLFDADGQELGAVDEKYMLDTEERTGVWPFALPQGHWSEIASKFHDYETSCLTWQMHHTRSESDASFSRRLKTATNSVGRQLAANLMYGVLRVGSWIAWDWKPTKWK